MCFWKEHKRGWRTRCRISLIAPKAIHHLKCVSRFGLISCAISDKRDADQVLGTIVEALIGRFRPTQSSSSVHVSLSKFGSQRLFLYYFVVGQFARRVRKKTCLQEPLENPQFCSRFQPRPEGNQLCKRNPADYCFLAYLFLCWVRTPPAPIRIVPAVCDRNPRRTPCHSPKEMRWSQLRAQNVNLRLWPHRRRWPWLEDNSTIRICGCCP